MIRLGQARRRAGIMIGAALLSLVCAGAEAKPATIPPKIDTALAERLVSEGNFNDDRHLDALDPDGPIEHGFLLFTLVTPYGASAVAGYSSVNPWTGDVWDMWGCNRLSTPSLRRSQALIRARFTRAERKYYAALSRLKPDCP